MKNMHGPHQLTDREISYVAMVLFQLKNGSQSMQDLKDATGLSYATINRARDWLIIAGCPMSFHNERAGGPASLYNDCRITLLDKTFSSDELMRWINNQRAMPDRFRPKFENGRYFKDRVIGEGRLRRLIRSIEARFGDGQ